MSSPEAAHAASWTGLGFQRKVGRGMAVPAPGKLCNSHFTDGETEDQKSNRPCPRVAQE